MKQDDFELEDELDELGDEADEADTQLNVAAPSTAAPMRPRAAVPSASAEDTPPLGGEMLGIAADVPVQLVAALGRKQMTLREILVLQTGDVVELQQAVSTRVDLVANGKLFARGELVDIDGQLGVRITQVVR